MKAGKRELLCRESLIHAKENASPFENRNSNVTSLSTNLTTLIDSFYDQKESVKKQGDDHDAIRQSYNHRKWKWIDSHPATSDVTHVAVVQYRYDCGHCCAD